MATWALVGVLGWPVVVAAAPPVAKRIPKPGIEVPAERQATLEQGLARLQTALDSIARGKDARAKQLLPDVQIFHRAVHDALKYQEFFDAKELNVADGLLTEGLARAEQLTQGSAPWTTATGLVVRGYVSRIDGSVQPYGIKVPTSYTAQTAGRYRLDIWLHGRAENLSELNFLHEHRTKPGQFLPPDTLVLHPYGRYCNAFKFAGEVDVFEALDAACAAYRVDDRRLAMRGFSMGGAGAWHLAVHHADRWFAANPGAGFVDTRLYLKLDDSQLPPWYEQRLWRLYDCLPYARNLFHCPTVAYSGELDRQKQAADLMAEALAEHGIVLAHVVGPKTEHKFHPDSAVDIERRLASLAHYGRDDGPLSVRFDTYTLKYNRLHWVQIDGLAEHWELASVDADCTEDGIIVDTTNVTDLTLDFPPGQMPFEVTLPVVVTIDDQELMAEHPLSDRSWRCSLHRTDDGWQLGERPGDGLRKRHNLQGPIDDAFTESFLIVQPSGAAAHLAVDAWTKAECEFAKDHWRRVFRGPPRVKLDTEVTDADLAAHHVVVFGDPQSNALLGRVAAALPIRWDRTEIQVGDRRFAAERHGLVCVYPNPLNPARYVVVNSGFTCRESASASNARQTPKLPDWAVIDITTPPAGDTPGGIADADFFGERWELLPAHQQRDRPNHDGKRI